MVYNPSKMLHCLIINSSEVSWDTDNVAYEWQLIISITVQLHGSKYTPVPYQYDGTDIVLGDWIGDYQSGYALKIVEIISQEQNDATLIVRDIDYYNRFHDLSGNVNGALSQGMDVYIFELGKDGLPMTGPMTDGVMPAVYQGNLAAHFINRNPKKEIEIYQPSHGLAVGNTVYVDTDGKYKTMAASRLFKNYFDKIVGVVTEVGFPTTDHFVYKPRGDYRDPEISTQLPKLANDSTGAASAGLPVYLDPNTNGGFTLTKPSRYALPLYIRLPDNGSIFLEGGGGAAAASGPLGYYTTTYKVATITDRNAIISDELEIGDLCFVADDGTGHWAKYIVTDQDQTTMAPTWTLLLKQTASTTDAKTATYALSCSSQSSFYLSEIAPGSSVTQISVNVTEAFGSDASLLIGDVNNNSRLVADTDTDLSVVGEYKIYPQYTFSGQQFTQVNGYFTIGMSTTGQANITVSFV